MPVANNPFKSRCCHCWFFYWRCMFVFKWTSMEKYFLDSDIPTFCVTATHFPAGVKAAHEQLHALLPTVAGRKFYGISWGAANGNIVYKAAVKQLYSGEAEKYGCETFLIRKGNYSCQTIQHWQQDETLIRKTFLQLLNHTEVDENGYCVEAYLDDQTLKCMVTLK